MKKRTIQITAAIAGLTAIIMSLAAPADAASTSSSPGVVTICSGTELSTTDSLGKPLSPSQLKVYEDFLALKCANPNAPSHGSAVIGASQGVSPLHVISGVGDLTAHATVTPGNMYWWTTASSMPTGTSKTLNCMDQFNYGTFVACGSASGSGSSLSTVTNWICPVPGIHYVVEAFLTYKGSDYWDTKEGTTL